MSEYHDCESRLSAVRVRTDNVSGGWVISYNECDYRGLDNRVWAKTVVTIPVVFCPWCGERLEGADDGEKQA